MFPESCAVVRKGDSEALTGVYMGRVLSREMGLVRDADALGLAEGNTVIFVIARI